MSSLSVKNLADGGGGGNGCKWLRYEYENCMCRQIAILKIVADTRKPSIGMLYFVCEKKGKVGGCHYFRWCYPKCVDFEGYNYLVGNSGHEDEVGGEYEVDSEVYPKRCEGGSKVKDCILVLFAGFSLVVSFVAIMVKKAFGVEGLQDEVGDEIEIEKTCDEAQVMLNEQTDEVQIASAVDVSHVNEVLSLKLNYLDWEA